MMNEEERLPFFLNTRRIQTADGYFEIGRTQDKLRKLLAEKNNWESVILAGKSLEDSASVGFYGVKRYLSLLSDKDEDDLILENFTEVDEDVQFENTSAFSLFWMTFKRIALSIGERFSIPSNFLITNSSSCSFYPLEFTQCGKYIQCLINIGRSRLVPDDPEYNRVYETRDDNLYKVLVDPSFRDSRITQSKIVYGDVNYLIQKFRMDLNCGSLDIALFSVELPNTQFGKFDTTDIQAYVISPECGSFVWIEDGKASAIFMTKSSTDFFGNVLEWFRKILSDMALADSVMIGHPYYWHATVRRRLTKVMKYMKRLYRNLALKEKERHNRMCQSEKLSTEAIAIVCPTEISKIVINEQPTEDVHHSSSTYEKLNIMIDQLVKKWLDYQLNLKRSLSHSLKDISRTWAESSPQSLTRGVTDDGNFLESVTFLDFHPDKRNNSPIDSNVGESTFERDSNNNIVSEGTASTNKISCLDTGQNFCNEGFQSGEREGCCYFSKTERDDRVCKDLPTRTDLQAASLEIDGVGGNVANAALTPSNNLT